MHVVVDLARCQSYGQCLYFAPGVFSMHGREILEYESAPEDSALPDLVRARAACPVQAITIGRPISSGVADDGEEHR